MRINSCTLLYGYYEGSINQSIYFVFQKSIYYVQGCYHMDMEIVKNTIQIPSNMNKKNEKYYVQKENTSSSICL